MAGAGGGLGRETALLFAREGAAVAVVDRDRAAAEKTAADIAKAGGKAIGLAADVTSDADCARMVANTEQAFGRLCAFQGQMGVDQIRGAVGQEFMRHIQIGRDHVRIEPKAPQGDNGGEARKDGEHGVESHACGDQAHVDLVHAFQNRRHKGPDLAQHGQHRHLRPCDRPSTMASPTSGSSSRIAVSPIHRSKTCPASGGSAKISSGSSNIKIGLGLRWSASWMTILTRCTR